MSEIDRVMLKNKEILNEKKVWKELDKLIGKENTNGLLWKAYWYGYSDVEKVIEERFQ